MLKIDNLYYKYGGIRALKGVSLEVNKGEIVAVLGSNGAGKSTMLNNISGVLKPESGTITFEGKKLPTIPYKVVQQGVIHVPEGRKVFPDLTVYENLLTGSFLRTDHKGIQNDIEYVYELFPILSKRCKQYAGFLSGGEQQMLAISRGLMAHPKLLMLDEPSLGLAPIIVKQIFEIIQEISKSGVSILLVEQNAYKALKISHRAYILSVGNIEKSASSKELLSDKELTKAYLGV